MSMGFLVLIGVGGLVVICVGILVALLVAKASDRSQHKNDE